MSVLTGRATESACMENLRARRREMADMTETNLGEIVQDFHWMMRTDLHLSQCQHRLCSTLCYWIVLLQAKSRKKSLIFGELQCGERSSFIFEVA